MLVPSLYVATALYLGLVLTEITAMLLFVLCELLIVLIFFLLF
jgi:hypothetical protein